METSRSKTRARWGHRRERSLAAWLACRRIGYRKILATKIGIHPHEPGKERIGQGTRALALFIRGLLGE
jgi:hypothetical protein